MAGGGGEEEGRRSGREGGPGEESAGKNYMHNNMQRCVSRREETSLRRNVCVSNKNALSRRAASSGMSRDLQEKKRGRGARYDKVRSIFSRARLISHNYAALVFLFHLRRRLIVIKFLCRSRNRIILRTGRRRRHAARYRINESCNSSA